MPYIVSEEIKTLLSEARDHASDATIKLDQARDKMLHLPNYHRPEWDSLWEEMKNLHNYAQRLKLRVAVVDGLCKTKGDEQ